MDAMRNIGIGLLVVAALLIAKWPSFVANGIRHDLHEYAKAIRACDQSLDDKERLLDRIDAVEAQLDDGATPSMFGWTAHDDAIKAMLSDGITPDEVRLIERELQKVERKLMQPSEQSGPPSEPQ
ncbi:MAG: hypothetical protein AB7I37_17765 [Pirellulales bacterium]